MAQKVLVQLVDDLDGTSPGDVSTVWFGLDGVEYEIDVTAANAEQLRKNLAEYVAAGRRTGGRVKRGTSSAGKAAASGEAGRIREWAIENGFDLSARGRIPSHVVAAYKEAQQPKASKSRSSAKRVSTKKS